VGLKPQTACRPRHESLGYILAITTILTSIGDVLAKAPMGWTWSYRMMTPTITRKQNITVSSVVNLLLYLLSSCHTKQKWTRQANTTRKGYNTQQQYRCCSGNDPVLGQGINLKECCWWRGGAVGRASDLRFIGRRFESHLSTIVQWPWASYLRLCASVTKQYNLIPVKAGE